MGCLNAIEIHPQIQICLTHFAVVFLRGSSVNDCCSHTPQKLFFNKVLYIKNIME